jgi:membrane dipeptidase
MATPLPIFDGHNDTLLRLFQAGPEDGLNFFARNESGHLDLPRALEGGLGGGFFAIFTPNKKKMPYPGDEKIAQGYEFPLPPPIDQPSALQTTISMAALLYRLEAEAEGKIKVVRTADEMERCLREGTFAIIFHIEGAEAIDTGLDTLSVLYQAGLRSLGLVWSRSNAFGHGVPFKFPGSPDTGPGLTGAGRELVKACNRLGIVVDVSHLNEKGFWDVVEVSDAPIVATHSGAYTCSNSTRNLTDKQLDALAERDGVAGVNFHVGFLRADGKADPDSSLTEIVRHARYIAGRIGIDHVALGSDFDGATMPGDLKDVAGLPKLIAALRDGGFDDNDLRKIAYQNWLRVLQKTWKE